MTNPVHLLSVAALLLVAFLVGAILGTVLRLIVLQVTRKPAAVVETPVVAPAAAPPLVATPVIAPLPIAPTPTAPPVADVPVPDFAATMIALAGDAPPAAFLESTRPHPPVSTPQPLPELRSISAADAVHSRPAMEPARAAGETTSGLRIAAPLHENPGEAVGPQTVEQRTADVIPFPSVVLDPPTEQSSDMVVGGEAVAIVDASDLTVGAVSGWASGRTRRRRGDAGDHRDDARGKCAPNVCRRR